jgi:hypothetical protein
MIISAVDCQETPAKQRQFERQALAAREWFKQHGPPDAPVFPIGYAEREELKMGGLPHIVAWYARSLAARKYNLEEHPSFDEYASGVMASEKHAPGFIRDNEEMRRRFPPRPLAWLESGLYWCPPKPEGAQPEKRSRRSQQREKLLYAAIHAEDEAVEYLHKFDPAVASATACSVDQTLAIKWETKQEEMRRRRDPRKVMCITDRRWSELYSALARVPPGVHSDAAAEHHLLQILKGLPPDRAWWVSHLVVRYQDAQFRRSQLSADREQLANVPISELVLPEAIRRAAARASSDYREIQR